MGRPQKYPEEFRREAVELYRSSDRSRAEVAKSLGISDGSLAAMALGRPTRNSRCARRREPRTSCAPEARPDSRSRVRRVPVPAGEPGRSLCQDVALRLELAHLAAQTRKLLALGTAQSVFTDHWLTAVDRCLRDPVADRLRRATKLLSEFLRVTTGVHQFNHLLAKFRRVWGVRFRHRGRRQPQIRRQFISRGRLCFVAS